MLVKMLCFNKYLTINIYNWGGILALFFCQEAQLCYRKPEALVPAVELAIHVASNRHAFSSVIVPSPVNSSLLLQESWAPRRASSFAPFKLLNLNFNGIAF